MQPKESIRLIQISQWRSTARIDDLSQNQVMQPGNQFNSGKSADGDQQLALATAAKSRSCSPRNQFGSNKSAEEDQQLTLTTLAKSRSCRLTNQFSSYKLADRDQQLALTTSAKSRSCSLGISSTQASHPMKISDSR